VVLYKHLFLGNTYFKNLVLVDGQKLNYNFYETENKIPASHRSIEQGSAIFIPKFGIGMGEIESGGDGMGGFNSD
jgi:hypothetical protein